MRYFVEVSFCCDDDAIWDTLTRYLGFVEAETLDQAITLHHSLKSIPLSLVWKPLCNRVKASPTS